MEKIIQTILELPSIFQHFIVGLIGTLGGLALEQLNGSSCGVWCSFWRIVLGLSVSVGAGYALESSGATGTTLFAGIWFFSFIADRVGKRINESSVTLDNVIQKILPFK